MLHMEWHKKPEKKGRKMSVNNHVLLDVIEIFEDFLEEKGVIPPLVAGTRQKG